MSLQQPLPTQENFQIWVLKLKLPSESTSGSNKQGDKERMQDGSLVDRYCFNHAQAFRSCFLQPESFLILSFDTFETIEKNN